MYCVYSLPFAAARDENGSAISHTASLRENSVRSGNGFSSSRRQSVTRLEMSLDSRPDCDWMFCTHSFSPLSIANTSALVEMAVSGVLSSWLAHDQRKHQKKTPARDGKRDEKQRPDGFDLNICPDLPEFLP